MTFTAAQLQDAFAVATENIQKDIPDLMTKANFFWYKIMQNKEYLSGGRNIQFPVNHKELESQGFINGTTDVLSTNPQQSFTFGTLNWKFFYDKLFIQLKFDSTDRANWFSPSVRNLVWRFLANNSAFNVPALRVG